MSLELGSLRKSVASLQRVMARSDDVAFMAAIDADARDAIRSGVIQHFVCAYERGWKFMKRWIETQVSVGAADGVSRRELFRLAAEQRLIDDVDAWMRHHAARNKTSHTYEAETAHEVFEAAHGFAGDAARLLAALEARND